MSTKKSRRRKKRRRSNIIPAIILAVIAAAIICAFFFWKTQYDKADASDVPVTPITVAGQEVFPMSAKVTVPVLGGLQEKFPGATDALEPVLKDWLEKPLFCLLTDKGEWWIVPEGTVFDMQDPATWLGLLGEARYALDVKLPDTMLWTVSLTYNGENGEDELIYSSASGASENIATNIIIKKSGNYTLQAEGALERTTRNEPAGTFYYRAYFNVKDPDPVITEGRAELAQGDIFSLKFENVPDGVTPEIESLLGPAIFTKGVPRTQDGTGGMEAAEGFTNWYAAIPISNTRSPDEYIVRVHAGEFDYETTVTVIAYEFAFQNMIIDTSVPSVAQALTSAAYAEFREKVSSLFPLLSEERYWDGVFIMPVNLGPDDFISTEFGEIRITNGDQGTRRSHNGVDLAVPSETPVYACGRGMVLVAEFLLNTGNTVVIDHGGGLKSFHYHMNSVAAEAGTIIEQGELIGRVGSTGYSTGPHLHFEMRIGEQPVSPSMICDPDAGLYSAE